MPPSPAEESRILPWEYIHRPPIGDWIDMEYVLDRADPGQRTPLLANFLNTIAEVHQALAKGAMQAAQIIAGEDG